jgi:hypothetical protein
MIALGTFVGFGFAGMQASVDTLYYDRDTLTRMPCRRR